MFLQNPLDGLYLSHAKVSALARSDKSINHGIRSLLLDAVERIVNADVLASITNESAVACLAVLRKGKPRVLLHIRLHAVSNGICLGNHRIGFLRLKPGVIHQCVTHLLLVTLLPRLIVKLHAAVIVFHHSRLAVHVKQSLSRKIFARKFGGFGICTHLCNRR